MTRTTGGRTRLTSTVARRVAMLVVIIGGVAPTTAHAAPASTLPGSFVTYPISSDIALYNPANDLRPGPDGRMWTFPGSGSTIDRVTTAGVDSPLQWGPGLTDPHITAGSDGNLWMSNFAFTNAGVVGEIDKISPTGTLLATYPTPDLPIDVLLGPDGNVWYSGQAEIGRITPTGNITYFPWPGAAPGFLANGPDGNLWVADSNSPQIARITPSGVITAFPVPAFNGQQASPGGIAAGSDGNIWYLDGGADVIGRLTPGGVVTQFVPPDGIQPTHIAAGPDGNLWFTDAFDGHIGRITTTGQIGVVDTSSAGAFADNITPGPDGRMWLTFSGPPSVAAFQPFTPTPSPPDIRNISTRYTLPSGGGQVTVTGYDVGFATQVFFGSTPATSFSVLGPSQLVATVPPHAVGAVDITLATPYGTSVTSAPTLTTTGSHFYYQATNCGTVISQSTQLTGDIGPCYTGGLTVAADNVTLDLNRHGVVGFQDPRDGSVVGISLQQRSGVTITNGTVSGFDAGIHIAGGSGNTVDDMQIHDNIGPDSVFLSQFGDGIFIEQSASNQIVHNVIDHNGVFDGIGVFGVGSDGNTIVNNVVENNIGTSDHGPTGEGIIINGASGGTPTAVHSSQVINNVVRNNASGGIANINEIGGTILKNQVEGNGTANSFGNGIGVQIGRNWNLGPTQMLIQHNDVRGNGVDGIRLGTAFGFFRGSPQGNTVTDNVSVGNATNPGVDLYERGIKGYDLHDLAPNCGTNVWSRNQWGSAGFSPPCTTTGGSGPAPSAGPAPPQAAPNATSPNAASPPPGFPNAQAWENFLEQGRP